MVPWVYGIRKTKRGLITFAVRLRPNTDLGYVVEEYHIMAPSNSLTAREAADQLYCERLRQNPNYPWSDPPVLSVPKQISEHSVQIKTVEPGSFCWHNDKEGVHAALVLKVKKKIAKALFLTSKNGWNRYAREATEQEVGRWLGHPNGKRPSWLAPVTRPIEEFYMPKSFPLKSEEIYDYLEEFEGGWE